MIDDYQIRLLMVGNFLSKSIGTRWLCEELRDRFQSRGYRVLATSEKKNRLFRLLDMAGTVVNQRSDYDVVLVDVYSGPSFLWAEIVCFILRIIRKPYLLTLRGGALPEFAQGNPVRVKRLLDSANIVVTPSCYIKEMLASLNSNIMYLANGMDVSQYAYRLPTEALYNIVWLRAFHKIYQPEMAVKVLARLCQDIPDIQLTMIGPDKGDGSLQLVEETAKLFGVEDHVSIVGSVPKKEVASWLSQGDVFLNTTRIESFGVSVVEAAAVGLPVVTTDAGELPYLWRDGFDALVVPVNNVDQMAASVKRVLLEPGLAQTLAQNARKKVEQFDWANILPQWEALLQRLV